MTIAGIARRQYRTAGRTCIPRSGQPLTPHVQGNTMPQIQTSPDHPRGFAPPLRRHARPLALLVLLALAACDDREAQAGVSAAEDLAGEVVTDGPVGAELPSSADGRESTPAPSSADQIEVSISDPPFDGTHRASGDMRCFTLNGHWSAHFENGSERGLSGMQVVVNGVPATGGTGEEVQFSLMFGQMVMDDFDPNSEAGLVQIHGTKNSGDARVTVTREGAGAVLRIEGTTHYGAQVKGVVRCRTVDFMQ